MDLYKSDMWTSYIVLLRESSDYCYAGNIEMAIVLNECGRNLS